MLSSKEGIALITVFKGIFNSFPLKLTTVGTEFCIEQGFTHNIS